MKLPDALGLDPVVIAFTRIGTLLSFRVTSGVAPAVVRSSGWLCYGAPVIRFTGMRRLSGIIWDAGHVRHPCAPLVRPG